MSNPSLEQVWVFMGEGTVHPCAVFTTLDRAEQWIAKSQVSGILTAYPLDCCVYDWIVQRGAFTPKHPSQTTPKFIQRFSSAYAEHYHYEDGKRA